MRVVHLTSNHSPDDVRIFLKEACTLRQAGHQVKLIVPTDKPDWVDDIEILAIPKPKNRLDRFVVGFWRMYKAALTANAEVYHFHDPDLIPLGLLLRLQGKTVLYDVHEDVPKDILSKFWIPPFLRGLIAKSMTVLEWFAALWLSGVIAATPTIAQRWPREKTVVVQNFPFQRELAAASHIPYDSRPNQLVYLGGIEVIRGIREMVAMMDQLPSGLAARLVLGGRFKPPTLQQEMQEMPGWKRVEFLGWVSREQMGQVYAETKLGLVVLHSVPNYLESWPIKLFEYMSAGIPVVASDFPLWREVVQGAGCGLLVDPMDVKAIAKAVQYLLEHPTEAEEMGRRGQLAVQERYNWEAESRKLVDFYRRFDA